MSGPDWGAGRYERTAEQLLPAAEAVVAAAAPAKHEYVVDVGCGTGNATLLVARAGARVTGIDPSERLVEVARERAAAEGLRAKFAEGDAASLPLVSGTADVLLSVFGVIFAPDAEGAATEMARATAASARIVLSAWQPGGAIGQAVRAGREAVNEALGAPPGPPPFAWHDADALTGLLGPHGFAVEPTEHELAFTGDSPAAYLEAEVDSHPLWAFAREVLEPRGELEAVKARSLEILEAGNEDPSAFRVTSRYVVAVASRDRMASPARSNTAGSRSS